MHSKEKNSGAGGETKSDEQSPLDGDFVHERGLDTNDVVRAFSFLLVLELILHRIALRKNIAETSILHIALVKENFLSSLSDDKSKTLRHVKELYRTVIHRQPTSHVRERLKKKTPDENISLGLYRTDELRPSLR